MKIVIFISKDSGLLAAVLAYLKTRWPRGTFDVGTHDVWTEHATIAVDKQYDVMFMYASARDFAKGWMAVKELAK